MHWQLQDAKNKFSQLVQLAKSEGPQIITVQGVEEAVVVSRHDYEKLIGRRQDLVDFLEASPWADTELEIERSSDSGRHVEL